MDDVEAKVFDRLPDETWVYPGHGTTPPSASSARTWPSGARAAGNKDASAWGYESGFCHGAGTRIAAGRFLRLAAALDVRRGRYTFPCRR